MTYQQRHPILALMRDGQQRTSYQICDALHGPQDDGVKWYAVASSCDALVQSHRLVTCGKHEHRTVYMISEQAKEQDERR